MSQFTDLLAAGLSQTMDETKSAFIFRGQEYHGIYSELNESNNLGDGGFEQLIDAQLIIPFTEGISPDPKHDEKVTVNGVVHKIGRPIQKDEVSWTLNLISAK